MPEPEEAITQLPQDDWVDQDLLTKDEAGSKLDAEIAAERRRIEELGDSAVEGPYTRDQLQARLDAMVAVREGLRHRG